MLAWGKISVFTDVFKKFLSHHVADAVGGSAIAGVFLIIGKVVSIIEGDFLALGNIMAGNDPDSAFNKLSIAIGRAAMINETGRIPVNTPIQVILIVQRKNEPVFLFTAPQ